MGLYISLNVKSAKEETIEIKACEIGQIPKPIKDQLCILVDLEDVDFFDFVEKIG